MKNHTRNKMPHSSFKRKYTKFFVKLLPIS